MTLRPSRLYFGDSGRAALVLYNSTGVLLEQAVNINIQAAIKLYNAFMGLVFNRLGKYKIFGSHGFMAIHTLRGKHHIGPAVRDHLRCPEPRPAPAVGR